jgi:PKD repeat protein
MEDGIASVFENSDGNYFISCNSYSGISGDKSESNLGLAQAWIIKTDTLGNKIWDKTILTDPEQKVYPLMVQTADGCYAIAEATYGNVAGDKTQPNWDTSFSSTDYWIITYCDTTSITSAAFTASAEICPGTCIDFTNLSTGATSYQWFFPGSNTPVSTDQHPTGICYPNPGSYDVTLIASGSSGTDSISVPGYITVFPQPAPQAITQSGDTLFANAGSVTYQWYLNGNIIPGATDSYYVAMQSGNYNVVAADSNGCEVEAVIFDVIARIETLSQEMQLSISPNPAKEYIVIKTVHYPARISIYAMPGTEIIQRDILSGENKIDIQDLPPGIYSIQLHKNHTLHRIKFIRE